LKADQRGYILLAVALGLALLAAVAFVGNREAAMNVELTSGRAQVDQLRYSAEAGVQHVNRLLQDNNCGAGQITLASTPFGSTGYSYSGNASPIYGGSKSDITSTGILTGGPAMILTKIGVNSHQTTALTFVNKQAVDTYIRGKIGEQLKNYGADTTLAVRGDADTKVSLVQFDLSVIPPASKVTAATLSLYQTNANGSATVEVHRVTHSWTPGTRTGAGTADGATWTAFDGIGSWTVPGADYEASPAASLAVPSSDGWNSWDVTPLVQDWVSGTYLNMGVALIGSAGSNTQFVSYDNTGTPTSRPQLTVTYFAPCAVSTQKIGIAESVGAPVRVGTGIYDIPYTLTLQNMGSSTLTNVQVSNGLAATFPTFTIQGAITGSAPLTLNPAFTGGDANIKLLVGTDTLPVGPLTYTIQFTVRASGVVLGGPAYANTSIATCATAPNGPLLASDTSNNGDATAIDTTSSSPTRVQFFALARDAQLDAQKPTTNYGASTTIQISEWWLLSQYRLAALVDLSTLPPGAQVKSAKLRYYVASIANRTAVPKTVNVSALTQSWVEGTKSGSGTADGVTWWYRNGTTSAWASSGGTYRTPASATLVLPASFTTGYMEFDVTGLVQEWVGGTLANNGFMVMGPTSTDTLKVNSDEASANLPELVLTY
jgi:hypothetical protein